MFSIVIPVYNKAHTLRRTIEHALEQDFSGFEVILINDGSTDASLETLGEIEDPRLRIVQQSNAGPGAARNRGIAEAAYEWVAFLDADDVWHSAHLSELDRVRTRHPEAALIGTAFVDRDFTGNFVWPLEEEARIEPISYLDAIGQTGRVFFTSSCAARTSVLRNLGGFGPFARGEDTDLWVRIDLSYPVFRSTRPTVAYVHGTGGITETLRRPWPGSVPSGPEELSPAVATAIRARPEQPESRRQAIDRFIDRYVTWMLEGSASDGDGEAVRRIYRFHRGPPLLRHRLLYYVAWLPQPLTRGTFRILLALFSAARRWHI